MLSPDEQQVQICLLKSNLEEIENSLIVQRSALPELDAENEQQYRETMVALRVSRAQNDEIERLKQENVRLTAKRTQLKRQCEALVAALQTARMKRNELENCIKDEEQNDETNIRNYEDSLGGKAERFRQTESFYNEEEMTRQYEEVSKMNSEKEGDLERRQSVVSDLKIKLEALKPDVPEDLLAIMGKLILDEKLNSLQEQCEDLRRKIAELGKK
ncbi:hypothetical protein MSG28_009735 [Choristoneura fumiferana]|uniref:Uncharacterized protein n=1 Tax=Choristoneura fumiferana TaxID=7141 RepID=A0ACC0JCF4_CHOFU|nr:hypothetical protein MSG28_009735 [Choristoneura fumiferana]